MKMKGKIIAHHWACGDGCCSDTTFTARVTKGKDVLMDRYKDFVYKSAAREAIKDEFGDIPVEFVDDYSESD